MSAKRDKVGSVWLVGAGCGNPAFLTIQGRQLLARCQAVVYDNLVAEECLDFVPPDCERIYVGKRFENHSATQEEINEILIKKARQGKRVVRLKGGDPYVFGRGSEEMAALMAAGIPCGEAPGISSAIAVPAAAGIPVTSRGLSRSILILTGTAWDGWEPDFSLLARMEGTLVILMGMHRLTEIAQKLMAAGKDPDTPAAVITEGATPRQKCVRGSLCKIGMLSKEAGLQAPAVIVIGPVAALTLTGEEPRWESAGVQENQSGPLVGLRVGITGTESFSHRVTGVLEEDGAICMDLSFLRVEPGVEPLPGLENFSWLVFTSPNGVRIFGEKLRRQRFDHRRLYGKKIAAIGPGTAKALEELGFYADYMPPVYEVNALAQGMIALLQAEERTLFLRAEGGNPVLEETFDRAGLAYEVFPLYRLAEDAQKKEQVRKRVTEETPDAIVFGSASGARAWLAAMGKEGPYSYVCIGRQCAGALEEAGIFDYLTAETATLEGIRDALCYRRLQKDGKS